MWFVLSVVSGLASSIDKVLNRKALGGKGNSLAYSVVYLFLTSLFTLPFALPFNLGINGRLIFLIVLESLVWAGASASMFAAHVNTEVSLSSIISKTRILWIIPFSMILLNETTSPIAITGIIVIFLGLAILFLKNDLHKLRGVHLVLVSSLFAAAGSVISALLVRESLTAAQSAFIMMAGQTIVLFIILCSREFPLDRVKSVLAHSWHITLTATILEALAYILLNRAYQVGAASSTTAVYMAMSVSIVWIGVLFLGEKEGVWKKLISSIVVTCGVILVKVYS